MQQVNNAVSLDDSTASLLTALAELWGISKGEAVRISLEETSVNALELGAPSERSEATIIRAALESILQHSDENPLKITERERVLLNRLVHGSSYAEIASELNVNRHIVRMDLNALKAKVRSRLLSHRRRQASGVRARVKRLRALADLHSRLDLTPTKAVAWQEAVREARR
ncbi:MAG TPA: hypothetical protein VJV21_07045 [Pyrinomonadaceae bacterium]|nr:hypothetical protein [Pyrinomonadaceae bacterium]